MNVLEIRHEHVTEMFFRYFSNNEQSLVSGKPDYRVSVLEQSTKPDCSSADAE